MRFQDRDKLLIEPVSGFEWPTWLLIIFVYASWWFLLSIYNQLGPVFTGPLLIIIGALHGSLQHELLHGHPTRQVKINSLLAYPPISLLFPYPVYRETHIAHHNDDTLTIPGVDPESFYVSINTWQKSNTLKRTYYTLNMTILGRLLSGPASTAIVLSRMMIRDIASGSVPRITQWFLHLLLVIGLLYWIDFYFQVPFWHYLIIAYFANSLGMVRSFFEHKAVRLAKQRSIIVESGWFFRFLFLNNNYHLTHHEYPALCWYQLGTLYRKNREVFLKLNGHFVNNGYQNWLIGHLLKPVDSAVHPFAED